MDRWSERGRTPKLRTLKKKKKKKKNGLETDFA